MSIQKIFEHYGISKKDFDELLKAKYIADHGKTAEIKKDIKNDRLKVYEVDKRKR